MTFETLLREGIPERLFTRTNAIASALAFCALVIFAGGIYQRLAFALGPVPSCFGADEPLTKRPGATLAKATDVIFAASGGRVSFSNSYAEAALAAQKLCPPSACGAAASEAYRSKMFWYLDDRFQKTRAMQNLAGKVGLAEAIAHFSRSIDRELEQGLRDRYKAGLIDLLRQGWAQHGEALPMLMFRGAQQLKACGQLE